MNSNHDPNNQNAVEFMIDFLSSSFQIEPNEFTFSDPEIMDDVYNDIVKRIFKIDPVFDSEQPVSKLGSVHKGGKQETVKVRHVRPKTEEDVTVDDEEMIHYREMTPKMIFEKLNE